MKKLTSILTLACICVPLNGYANNTTKTIQAAVLTGKTNITQKKGDKNIQGVNVAQSNDKSARHYQRVEGKKGVTMTQKDSTKSIQALNVAETRRGARTRQEAYLAKLTMKQQGGKQSIQAVNYVKSK